MRFMNEMKKNATHHQLKVVHTYN